jgi:hypothetical protein
MTLGDNHTWHALSTCLWRSSFALANYQDLSSIYGELESFFVRRLGVRKASPGMLIKEVRRMAEERQPRIAEIRTRLVDIGMMLTKTPFDDSIAQALASLKEVKFMPKRASAGASTLVAVTDDFAIADHERYRAAFAEHNVLLDFQLDEVSMLHTMFQRLGISHRYLSNVVEEVSTVGEDSHVDKILSQQLVAKAYALYW